MSNPPPGWYPDPTGQPNIIRFWNGEKWTNQTEHEDAHRDAPPEDSHQAPSNPEPTRASSAPEPTQVTPEPTAPRQEPVVPRQEPVAPRQETAGPGLRSVQGPGTGTPVSQPVSQSEAQSEAQPGAQPEQADAGGWWQPSPSPQLWDAAPVGGGNGPRLRAVTPEDPAQAQEPTPAERARATWGAPEIAPAPPEHWTQREITDEQEFVATADVQTDAQPEEQAGNWTLKLAPEPIDEPTVVSPIQPTAADAGGDSAEGWSDVSWTAQPRFAPTPKEDVQAANADVQPADADLQPADGWSADTPDAELEAADAAQMQLQPDWGDQSDSQQEQQDQAGDQPSWGVEAQDQDDLQTPEQPTAGPLWSIPQPEDSTQEQPVVQLWGDQPQSSDTQQPNDPNQSQAWNAQHPTQPEQTWGAQQPGQPEQSWGAQQSGQPEQTWGAQQPGQPEQAWGAQQSGQQVPDQSWGAGQGGQQVQGQGWGAQQAGQPEQSWGAQAGGDNGWGVGDQHGVEDSGPWGQQATAGAQNSQHTGEQAWGGQSWPVQESADQQAGNGWGESQQSASPSWGATQQTGAQSWADDQQNGQQNGGGSWAGDQQGSGQSWGAGQQTAPQQTAPQQWAPQQNGGQQNGVPQGGVQQGGVQQGGVQQGGVQQGGVPQSSGGPQGLQQGGGPGGGQQAWGEQQGPRAWGEDANESWGGQTDLSTGVGKREKGKKPKGPGGGGGGFGAKLPLMVGGGIALVLLIVAAVFLITRSGDDKKADPNPTGATQPTGSPTSQGSTKPGQSKNPKLHEGFGRISSDAISFPRQNPPWSDRKRLVQQLLNSSGQHIVLQEKVNGGDDWSADIFVGGLGTGSGFNGDPKATAANLSVQLRTNMYGSIPVTYRTIANGAVKRTDKSGWFFQQSVTAKSAAVTDRVLTLTVAVFDLGDGTAVAYISGIPNNRPDLKAAESQAYKGINVG